MSLSAASTTRSTPSTLGKSAGPLQNGLPPLLEQAQVGSDIGLTLSGVDDQGVHPAPGPEDLHLGGEGITAHIHDAGGFYPDHQLLLGTPG